jgi:hypothetical protein
MAKINAALSRGYLLIILIISAAAVVIGISFACNGMGEAWESLEKSKASPTKFMFSGPAVIASGICTAFTLQAQSADGKTVSLTKDLDVVFSANPAVGSFSTNSGCTPPAGNVTFPAGSPTLTIYFSGSGSSATLTATASDFGSASTVVTFGGAP